MASRGCFGVLLVLPLLLTSTNAQAAAPRPAKERAARKACLDGDYTKGISLLSDLFLDTQDPNYLFNQGRCFEQNRRYEDAIARFEEYLRALTNPKLDKGGKVAAEKHIADCRKILAKQSGQTPTAAPPPEPLPVAPQVVPPPEPQPVAPPPALVVVQAPPRRSDGSGLRTSGIITASVGAAALIAGVALNLTVNSMASDMEKPGNYSSAKESDRKTYETMGWVGYGVGAACLVTGSVLYLIGRRSRFDTPPPVAMVPDLGPGHASAVLKGAF
jgi:tetratricopeptide (TPR) repeat protein